MLDLLAREPLLLLFVVAALGFLIGRIQFQGASLGVAAVLFVGLFFGALRPDLKLPTVVFQIGLVVFVYTIGVSSGPAFFASWRSGGLRDNLLVVAMLIFAAGILALGHLVVRPDPAISAGIYAGSLTNTPALAALVEAVSRSAPEAVRETVAALPVVGYSVAYPMGVLGPILAIFAAQTLWRIDYRADAKRVRGVHLAEQELYNQTVLVTRPEATGVPVAQLVAQHGWDVVFSRRKRGGEVTLVSGDTTLALGDLVSVVGTPEQVDAVVHAIGTTPPSGEDLAYDRSAYDFRRIFVSNEALAGRRLGDLNLTQRYGALVTRVRRGDADFLAHGDTVLELGDRVRVVAPREQMKALSELFGDSYKRLSEVNLLSFGLGVSLGLLVGLVPIPLPGGIVLKLGLAGGPLVVGLVLGALRRTGPILWTLPYGANLTLRQVGLILLLGGIGVNSGRTFVETLAAGSGVQLFLMGAAVSVTTASVALVIGYRVFKMPFAVLTGLVAGLHTQPAVFGFATEQSRNELPNVGYALAFPVATIAKIVIAQVVWRVLG
ncbi:MAG: transporter [Caldilineales bacterium]|nr:transporter [Caldilineales bacterium]MDW8319205.1 aspartate:alanine exchanger family transporter [Anaerolineae bacterium]